MAAKGSKQDKKGKARKGRWATPEEWSNQGPDMPELESVMIVTKTEEVAYEEEIKRMENYVEEEVEVESSEEPPKKQTKIETDAGDNSTCEDFLVECKDLGTFEAPPGHSGLFCLFSAHGAKFYYN